MNKVQYTGRLVKDVEVTTLKNEKQTKTVYFTIAVQDDYNRERADFINCQAFGPSVNYLNKHGKKGVYIEFSGKTSTYSKDDKYGSIAVADKVSIIFANSKKGNEKEQTEEEKILNDDPVF